MTPSNIHTLVEAKAQEIQAELKSLGRWDDNPLPSEKFENMGAFGCNTMTFVQWLQFVLLQRIMEIVRDKSEFPAGSMLAPYAIREFDGDPNAGQLHQLLYELDELANGTDEDEVEVVEPSPVSIPSSETIGMGDTSIPSVVFTLAELLPQFEGDDLESQLQTYDTFLAVLSPAIRPVISDLLIKAARSASNPQSRVRIEKAAESVAQGGSAAEPYDHDSAMKKYMAEHKKSFPSKG